jgi:hypothetical protein
VAIPQAKALGLMEDCFVAAGSVRLQTCRRAQLPTTSTGKNGSLLATYEGSGGGSVLLRLMMEIRFFLFSVSVPG